MKEWGMCFLYNYPCILFIEWQWYKHTLDPAKAHSWHNPIFHFRHHHHCHRHQHTLVQKWPNPTLILRRKKKSEIDFLRMILVPISSAADRCNNDLWGSCPATFSFMKYLQTMKEMPCTLAGKQFNFESGERERFNAKEKMPLKSSPCHLPQTIF